MRSRSLIAAVVLAAMVPAAPAGAAPEKPEPAPLTVTGLGWWQNREERITLERLLGAERGPTMDGNAVEDAVFLVISGLAERGFLAPTVEARLTLTDGSRASYAFDATLSTMLPPKLEARAMRLKVREGVRAVFHAVTITGLTAVKPEAAQGYFLPVNIPWVGAEARAYSPTKLRQAAEALLGDLRRRGYAEATVKPRVTGNDAKTGRVEVAVDVKEGPRWVVTAVKMAEASPAAVKPELEAHWDGKPWSVRTQQDITEETRRAFYAQGYPEVRVKTEAKEEAAHDGQREVTVTVTAEAGPEVRTGTVRFEGNTHTREGTLNRRVRVKPGEPLDPIKLEQARQRLARLGVFSSVEVREEPAEGAVRDPVFAVKELPRWDASLLAGYGSYEQLRGGVELKQTNLFGLAQQSRLLLVQSMKSTSGEYNYTVPELLGDEIDGTARIFGLRREEVSFLREEFGTTVALKRRLPWIGASGSAGYTYQYLQNDDNELFTRTADEGHVRVASIDLGLTGDHRDNPLRPHSGYRWFAQADLASAALGGQVDYQAWETGVAWHTPWGGGRWLHAGFTHGVITRWGAPDGEQIPVNTRFYPGGDSSIRGYQNGEASPRGADGRFIGAETYMLLNVELEQAITQAWSLVVFGDALGEAASLNDYPFDERLYSVGLGVRYQTIIGPVRLEYGHNLNPRPGDPDGTLHFSVGFPF